MDVCSFSLTLTSAIHHCHYSLPFTVTAGLLSLGLADNRISDVGASSLADLLRQSDTLQRLVLSGNDIHDEGGGTLVAALSQNRSLKALYLATVRGLSGKGGGKLEICLDRRDLSLPC